MRILAVQDSDWFERGPHQQHHLLERMSLRGHQVRVIDYPILWRSGKVRADPARRQFFSDGARLVPGACIEVVRPPIKKLPFLDYATHWRSTAKEVIAQCQINKPDVIVGYGILSDLGAVNASKQFGIPYIAHLLDALHQLVEPTRFSLIARWVESRNLHRAKSTIVINKALRDYAVALGSHSESTYVVPTGIDFDRFKPKVGRQEMREKLGIREGETVLFFMGWIYRFSGVLELARAVTSEESSDNDFRFLIVGEGDSFQNLLKLRDSSQGGKRLLVMGKQPYESIPDYLAAADVCVLPADNNETMRHIVPIKVYEYLAAGKPVISTELPGVIAEFGLESGVYFVRERESFLAKALALLHTIGHDKLSSVALASVSQNDWNTITDKFEDVLERSL